MTTRVLAVDDSAVILRLISQTLSKEGYQVVTCGNGPEALKTLSEVTPELVILDVMMPEMDGYEVCRQIRSRPSSATIPVMMLTALDSLENKIKGYEAGADDYLTKPFDPAELQLRVQALLRRSGFPLTDQAAGQHLGKVIAVFSLRGGTGVSSIAANLAAGLAQLWSTPTALADLAFTAGHSALMLNLSPRTSWANLVRREEGDIDPMLIDQVLLTHSSGVRVLAAPRRADIGESITLEDVRLVLGLLTQIYEYLVLDLPHDLSELTLAALDKADQVLMVIAPELGSVMNAAAALEIFESLGYAKDKMNLVLNQIYEHRYLTQVDIEAALNRRINVVIPFAADILVPAINCGVPPVLSAPTAEIGALMEDLAFFVSKEDRRSQPPAVPSPAWQRVSNRQRRRKK